MTDIDIAASAPCLDIDCSEHCLTVTQVRATGDDTLLAILELHPDAADGDFVVRQPSCPLHGDAGTLNAVILGLAAAQAAWIRADFDHDAAPGSYGAMCSAELADERRDEALAELATAVLRERLHLRGPQTKEQVREALVARARDADGWRAPSTAYAAGVDAVLEALTRVR